MKIFLLMALLTPVIISAQKTSKNVQAILSNGTVISGTIDDKEWLANPSTVSIRKTGATTVTTFRPEDLKSISIENGDRYVSETVFMEEIPENFDGPALEESSIISTEKKVFLLVNFSGQKFSIYSYRYKNKTRLFLQKKGEDIKELIHREYTIRTDRGMFGQTDNIYREQLGLLTVDCPSIKDEIQDIEYSAGSINKYIKKYYSTCHASETIYITKKLTTTFGISIIGGATMSRPSFQLFGNPGTPYYDLLTTQPLSVSTRPTFGIRGTYFIPRLHQKLSVALDATYDHQKSANSEYIYNNSATDYHYKTLTIDFQFLRGNFALRYALNRENSIRPFLQVGASVNIIISDESVVIRDIKNNGTNNKTTATPFPPGALKKSAFAFLMGGGVCYNRFGLEYRFLRTGQVVVLNNFKSSNNPSVILLSYQLNK